MTRWAAVALFAVIAASSCRRERADARSTPEVAEPSVAEPTATGGGPQEQPAPSEGASDSPSERALRTRLVDEIQQGHALRDPRVLNAMRTVPRHLFVPDQPMAAAYEDRPLPIGHGQTISQPTVVAMMTEALELRGGERVLEIGTGSGYQTAILSVLAKDVYSIELVEPLAKEASLRLKDLGYAATVRAGDGYRGWPEQAPFDRIIVTAAPPTMPKALIDQLAEGGILVAPVGEDLQQLVRIRKVDGKLQREHLGLVRFVPMVPGK